MRIKFHFGAFDDLSELATKYLGVEGCSQAEVKFHPSGEVEKDERWSKRVQNLHPHIHAFLKSPLLCNREYKQIKSVQVLDRLSVRLVEELETTYTLKGVSIPDPEPRPSCLDATDQQATLWLGLEADEAEYAELIGDALQDYLDIKELRGFVEDLLTKNQEKVLSSWQRRGLQTDFCIQSEAFPEEEEENRSELADEEPRAETRSGYDDLIEDESETGADPVQPEMTSVDTSGGHWGGTSDGRGRGGHSGGGGGGEGRRHRNLKKYLADNPSRLGEGLALVKVEYRFVSGDEADILLKDSLGSPVTVEVEAHISSGDYVGVWQAVKYKHLAAVEYGLPCEQVRSILVAQKSLTMLKQNVEH